MSFALDIGKWSKEATKEMADLNKATVIALFRSVIKDTPVLEGRLRANWIISKDDPAEDTLDKFDKTEDGGPTVNNVLTFVAKIDFEKDIDLYLANNLPYANFIEYGGSKVKRPEGMVRRNLIRVSENLGI